MSTHAKRPFRKATGIPGHVPPLRPQTAKRNVSNDIIVEEKQPSLQHNYQRPPTVIRNKATVSKPDSRITPRKGPQITNLPSRRPTTAQPIKAAKSNQIQGEIDYEVESAKLREECRKEFGVSIDEKDIEQPWLQDLTSIQDKLNENVYQTSIIDDNPISIMDQVSEEIMNSQSNDDPFKNAKKILDDSFSQFQEYMEQEKLLLDQRIALLQEFANEVQLHPASEYTADMAIEEADDLSNPIIVQTKMRPKTSSNATRERGFNDERRYVRKP